jgi:hypothetical protein
MITSVPVPLSPMAPVGRINTKVGSGPVRLVEHSVDALALCEDVRTVNGVVSEKQNDSLFQIALCLFQELVHPKQMEKLTLDQPLVVSVRNLVLFLHQKQALGTVFAEFTVQNLLLTAEKTANEAAFEPKALGEKRTKSLLTCLFSLICDGNRDLGQLFVPRAAAAASSHRSPRATTTKSSPYVSSGCFANRTTREEATKNT